MHRHFVKFGGFLLLIIYLCVGCLADQEDIELDQEQPDYLSVVAPHAGQTLSLETFQSGKHYPSDGYISQDEAANKICLEVVHTSLLEPGDYFSGRPGDPGEFFPERLSLTVDGQIAERDDGNVVSLLNWIVLRNEDKDIVAQAVGPQVICWLVDLREGTHVTVLDVKKTSGVHVSYTWAFTIVE